MIHIVTALIHEARPLIDFYRLEPTGNTPFQIYRNEIVTLIISGVGKKNSREAAEYLFSNSGKKKNIAWLNLGIGGHDKEKLGRAALAHRITDHDSGKSWYPPRILKTACNSCAVLTVGEVESAYAKEGVYDMEAAGFFEAASLFSTAELVQCFKIISDNSVSGPEHVSAKSVRDLVKQNLKLIDSIIQELSELSDERRGFDRKPVEMDDFMGTWHFTVTQSHQLRRLLSRLEILAPKKKWLLEAAGKKSAKDILLFLKKQLKEIPVLL